MIADDDPVPFVAWKPALALLTEGSRNEGAELSNGESQLSAAELLVDQFGVDTQSFDAPRETVVNDPLPFADFAEIQQDPCIIIKHRKTVFCREDDTDDEYDRESHKNPVASCVKDEKRCDDRADDG